jgi:hypothetical protein
MSQQMTTQPAKLHLGGGLSCLCVAHGRFFQESWFLICHQKNLIASHQSSAIRAGNLHSTPFFQLTPGNDVQSLFCAIVGKFDAPIRVLFAAENLDLEVSSWTSRTDPKSRSRRQNRVPTTLISPLVPNGDIQ